MSKRLMRSNDRVIAGVCIAYAFLTIFTAFCGLIFYFVLWLCMPEKGLLER